MLFVAHRGFEEVNRDVDVLLEVSPGDGEVAPGIVELRPEHLLGTYRDRGGNACRRWRCLQHAEVQPYDEWALRARSGTARSLSSRSKTWTGRLRVRAALQYRFRRFRTASRTA